MKPYQHDLKKLLNVIRYGNFRKTEPMRKAVPPPMPPTQPPARTKKAA
jgi:hypothetical protein